MTQKNLTPAERELAETLAANLRAFRDRKAVARDGNPVGAEVLRVVAWSQELQPAVLVVRCRTEVGGCGGEHQRKSGDVHQCVLCEDCRKEQRKAKRASKRGGADKLDAVKALLAKGIEIG